MSKAVNLTLTGLLFLSAGVAAIAADVNLNGIVGNKALLVIDGGKPRWLAVGESSPEGVKLVSITGDTAVFELGGKRQTVKMGQNDRLVSGGGLHLQVRARKASCWPPAATATLSPPGRSTANRCSSWSTRAPRSLRLVAAKQSASASIILPGRKAPISTANGVVASYKVKLDEVRVGGVTLNNVDGIVHPETSMPVVLLGMSFLNRMEMKRDGETMTLKKRF